MIKTKLSRIINIEQVRSILDGMSSMPERNYKEWQLRY